MAIALYVHLMYLILYSTFIYMILLYISFRRKALESIDYRTRLIREVISGIHVVKMYANEDLLTRMIGGVRRYVSHCVINIMVKM